MTPKKLDAWIKQKFGAPAPAATRAYVARYVGAVEHEDRKPDEQSRLDFWGLNVPTHRAVTKAAAALTEKEFGLNSKSLSAVERLEAQIAEWRLWLGVWNHTDNYDVRSVVLIWMSAKERLQLRRRQWKDLFAMAETVDNWALSDGLSMMIADVLEQDPKLFAHFKKWNTSKNPWLRRQSLVGIYCYARFRKKPIAPGLTLGLIEKLLDDPHFYVQRGVGWTLREVDRLDAQLQRAFVKKHLHRISGVAWFAASELYKEKDRKRLVSARKEHRAQQRKAKVQF